MSHSAVCACTLKENDLLDYAAEEKSFWLKKKKKKRQQGNEERQEEGAVILSMVDCDSREWVSVLGMPTIT